VEISIGTFFKDFTERRQRTSYSETETETTKFVGMLFPMALQKCTSEHVKESPAYSKNATQSSQVRTAGGEKS